VLRLRVLTDTTPPFTTPIRLGSKLVGSGWTTGGRKTLITLRGRNFFAYDGYEKGTAFACYYEYGRFGDGPTDSAFFHFGINTAIGIDSLYRAFIVGSRWGEYNLYITTKEVTSAVQPSETSQTIAMNSINASVISNTSKVTITLRLRTRLEGSLELYDILGREILTVQRGHFLEGESELAFEPKGWPSGVYFAVLESKPLRLVSKFVLVR
jgi:hypothetical protein